MKRSLLSVKEICSNTNSETFLHKYANLKYVKSTVLLCEGSGYKTGTYHFSLKAYYSQRVGICGLLLFFFSLLPVHKLVDSLLMFHHDPRRLPSPCQWLEFIKLLRLIRNFRQITECFFRHGLLYMIVKT